MMMTGRRMGVKDRFDSPADTCVSDNSAARGVPHFEQNFAPVRTGVWHDGQFTEETFATFAPHSGQNFASSGSWALHDEHFFI
jgi:hypothetical protein